MQRLGSSVCNVFRPKLAAALYDTEHNGFVRAALRAGRPLVGMLVLFLAADEGRIGLNVAFQRRVERIGPRRVAKAMEHEPRRFLRDFQVLGERGGGNALRVVRDKPNGHEPLAERQFRILEDRPDLDRKAIFAIAAFEGLAIGEMIDAIAAAMGAKLAIAPAD